MASVVLTLGDVRFKNFEVPESINFGGKQILVVHKLPGGNRVIDAMGRDDDDIKWSGRFRGSDAEGRARHLDYLRIKGDPVSITWGAQRYRVIIESFEANFQQRYEIPYSINCTVVDDEFAPVSFGIPGIDELLNSDLVRAIGISGLVDSAAINTALGGLQTAVGNVQSVRNADPLSITAIVDALTNSQHATSDAIIGSENLITTAVGTVGGIGQTGIANTLAANLSQQAKSFGDLNNMYQLSSTLTRMGANLLNTKN